MTNPSKPNKQDKWKKDWQLDLDNIIEDMESYTETESNLSYQDELHNRLFVYGLTFISTLLSQQRSELIEEVKKWSESEMERELKFVKKRTNDPLIIALKQTALGRVQVLRDLPRDISKFLSTLSSVPVEGSKEKSEWSRGTSWSQYQNHEDMVKISNSLPSVPVEGGKDIV